MLPKRTKSARRSLLFVPATTPDRFDKACLSGADIICLELEDAVPVDEKEKARAAALDWLSGQSTPNLRPFELAVRINALSTDIGQDDVAEILSVCPNIDLLIVPKAESAHSLRMLSDQLETAGMDTQLGVMIETVRSLDRISEIVSASPNISALLFGGVDLATELGCKIGWEPLLFARSQLIQAGRMANLDLLDMPCLHLDDKRVIGDEAQSARALGFDGKAAIHPAQLAPIHNAFTPDDRDVAEAEQILAAYERAGGGAASFNGRLIELPVMHQARAVLDRRARADLRDNS